MAVPREMMETHSDTSPVDLIMGMALGYLVSRSLYVATELGIADLLKDGARRLEELASATGTHQESLYRLLRTLAAHGVFAEESPRRFVLTPAAVLLQDGAMREGVLLCGEVTGDGSWWNAVGALRHSVMTGEAAFHRQQGMGFFDYLGLHPQCHAWFDRGLANFATAENPAIAGAYDFSRFDSIIDLGGGQGGLLAEILKRCPTLRAILFDQPQVVKTPTYLTKEKFGDRWTTVGGDFFQSVPKGGDAYVLKRILHDWSDDQCVRILRCCREAMDTNTRLLVIDAVVPLGNVPHPGKVMDMLMMIFGEGRERTREEFGQLFAQAKLQLATITTTPSPLSILEAIPA
ncbi:MAG: SAM-dependent methyltransferase [Deltaproteobacteria bacterium]|nr:SAM-dependent methyltransferase [Deltaproteobacteria bacterium]